MTDSFKENRIRLRSDVQQWELDRAVYERGRSAHFQIGGRKLPQGVRMQAMVSKHLGRIAQRLERLAVAEDSVGHKVTALDLYFEAAARYAAAQHGIYALTSEKHFLHSSALRCYDEVRRLAPHRIEHIDVPWGGTTVSGYLHLVNSPDPKPLIFLVPGCDATKEMLPHPLYNWAIQRDMHLFVFDGPGQGESNIRGIPLTVTNYEEAAIAALSFLLERPDVDHDRVGLYAYSFGSYWGARIAATDDRYKGAALPWASVCDKYHLFEQESPRFKQLFSFLTQATSEAELDEFINQMGLEDLASRIQCPTLLTVGEYDPRSPLEEVYEFFDLIEAPAELWVLADQHHEANVRDNSHGPSWLADTHAMAMDWLQDRLSDKPFTRGGEIRYVENNGPSPNDPQVPVKRRWFEEGSVLGGP